MKSVKLNVKDIDRLIRYWRRVKKKAKNREEELVASCYVDAFQTVRVNHKLPLLPKEEE